MPVYQYKCDECMKVWEQFHKVDDRHNEFCCDMPATIVPPKTSRPVVLDHYSENADIYFTGPKQREEELRKRGLTPVEGGVTKFGDHHLKERM